MGITNDDTIRYIKGLRDVANKEANEFIKQLGYKGCKNCKYQIDPLRMCEWAEGGGDGKLHVICPKWDKREEE